MAEAAVSPPPAAETREMTADELWALAARGRCELVRGRLVPMSPTSGPHGKTEFRAAFLIGLFLQSNPIGQLYTGETGFLIARNPDTVRGADVAFLLNERAAQVPETGFVPFPPDLVVEVVSPDDTWSDVRDKVEEWLAAGAQLVWVFDPQRKRTDSFSPSGQQSLKAGDTLTGGDVLPGFAVPVSEFFK